MKATPHFFCKRFLSLALVVAGALGVSATAAYGQTLAPGQRLCDPEYQDCRADILAYIAQENVEIDMGYWLIDDDRYTQALVAAWNRGVKVRLLMDTRCIQEHSACAPENADLVNAGLPMRNRITSGILHWKMILFAGQNQVEFAGANFSPFELVPDTPYQNYTDEVVMFSNDPSIVGSFMSKFDDMWTSTTEFANYANINGPLTRSYPNYPEDPQLNFPNDQSYRNRAIAAYNAENQQIDIAMFRITDEQETDAIINAFNRGVKIRLFTNLSEYRLPLELFHSYNVDKLYHAGIPVRVDAHEGINHEKAVILYGTHTAIFGSSNWTSASTDRQREHNMFTTQSWIFDWLVDQFNRKWTNGSGFPESEPFTPLPPDPPINHTPANGATGLPATGTSLSWNGGYWGQLYDIYFGTSSNPPLIASDQKLGPSKNSSVYESYALPQLQPGTTYYWKIVSKTMAYLTATGPVWSFTTAGTASAPPNVSITSPVNGASFTAPANITITASASDSDGSVAKVDIYQGSTLIGTATSSPYSVTWNNVPAGGYSLTAVATDNTGSTATSSVVSVAVSNATSSLPNGWSDADIGSVPIPGSASYDAGTGTFTITGSGSDIWNTADAFNYAYLPLDGDGSVVARVASVQNIYKWTKAGVMIRGTLDAGSANAMMLVSASAGVAFQRRDTNGASSVTTMGSTSTAPHWVKLTRTGNTFSGYESDDGTTWTLVGTDIIPLAAQAFIGLAVSSHSTSASATSTFDNVTVSEANPNNSPSVSITSPANGSTYTAPASVTVTASAGDADGTVAKVDFYANSTPIGTATTAPYTINWNNVAAGVYTLTAVATDNLGATTTSSAVSITVNTQSTTSLPNGWSDADVGSVPIAGSASYDSGSGTFTITGSGADIWNTADAFHYAYTTLNGDGTIIARVVTIQDVAAWVKAAVMIRETLAAGSTHALMLVSSQKGVAFQRRETTNGTSLSTPGSMSQAPHWIKLTRSGDTFTGYESADGVSWTEVGSDTIPMAAQVFIGLAVTSHTTAASATCTFDQVSVSQTTVVTNAPPSVSITSPADGSTFTAPASITVTASASDSDGSVSKVDFYANSTLLGTVTAAPYTITWSNVGAGAYTLTAVATDDSGATTTSAAVSMTVNANTSNALPAGWSDQDIGNVPFAGSATYNSGTFTVTGSGLDISGNADAFHYADATLNGDGTIVARVATVQDNAVWVKAAVMIRETLDPGSAHALMLVSSEKGVAFQWRPTTNGTSFSTAGSLARAPHWIKLTRNGDTFTGYESDDGTTWTQVGTATIPMAAQVHIGLAVTSHSQYRTSTCTFDNVTIQ